MQFNFFFIIEMVQTDWIYLFCEMLCLILQFRLRCAESGSCRKRRRDLINRSTNYFHLCRAALGFTHVSLLISKNVSEINLKLLHLSRVWKVAVNIKTLVFLPLAHTLTVSISCSVRLCVCISHLGNNVSQWTRYL